METRNNTEDYNDTKKTRKNDYRHEKTQKYFSCILVYLNFFMYFSVDR
jgi:hypothetical protein